MKMKQLIKLTIVALAFPGVGFVRPTAHAETCVPPPPGLIAWHPGDGNANDIQAGNDGTLQNGVTFAAGEVGQGFNFTNLDQRVEVPDSASLKLTTAVTLQKIWIRRGGFALGASFPRSDLKAQVNHQMKEKTICIIRSS
jgi:hypothetical protein